MNANVRVESCREANGFIKEYWKVILSLLMLIAGAIMNQLDVAFFRDNTISLVCIFGKCIDYLCLFFAPSSIWRTCRCN